MVTVRSGSYGTFSPSSASISRRRIVAAAISSLFLAAVVAVVLTREQTGQTVLQARFEDWVPQWNPQPTDWNPNVLNLPLAQLRHLEAKLEALGPEHHKELLEVQAKIQEVEKQIAAELEKEKKGDASFYKSAEAHMASVEAELEQEEGHLDELEQGTEASLAADAENDKEVNQDLHELEEDEGDSTETLLSINQKDLNPLIIPSNSASDALDSYNAAEVASERAESAGSNLGAFASALITQAEAGKMVDNLVSGN